MIVATMRTDGKLPRMKHASEISSVIFKPIAERGGSKLVT